MKVAPARLIDMTPNDESRFLERFADFREPDPGCLTSKRVDVQARIGDVFLSDRRRESLHPSPTRRLLKCER
jgi:hypothetical protein